MLEKNCIRRTAGSDYYKIKGAYGLYSLDELADMCDRNNFGYRVVVAYADEIVLQIYTD